MSNYQPGSQAHLADKRFAKLVTRARKEHDLTNKEIAEQIGVDQSLMTLIQKNGHVPNHDICLRLAAVLGINEDSFLVMAGYANDRIRSVFLAASGVLS
jgi:transcriptional regulator with XRE-family HTH domain